MGMTDKELLDRLAPLRETKMSDEQFERLSRRIRDAIHNGPVVRKSRRGSNFTKSIVAVVLSLVLAGTCFYTFTYHNTASNKKSVHNVTNLSSSVSLSGIRMYGNEIGWMVGNNQRVLRTTDGGRRWKDVTPYEITATSSQIVTVSSARAASIAVGTIQGQKAYTTIYQTVNGGEKWSKISLKPSASDAKSGLTPASMMFVDKNHGWISTQIPNFGMGGSQPGPLYRTVNGGSTWNLVSQTVAKNIVGFNWVYFLDSKTGFTEGAKQVLNASAGVTNTDPERLYVTHDGGVHWVQANIGLPSGNSVNLFQPTFLQRGKGVLPVIQTNASQHNAVYLYVTSDFGLHWSESAKLYVNQPRDNPVIDVLNSQQWWVYWGGRLYTTSNAGKSFVSIKLSINNLSSLDFIDGKLGFAIVQQIGTNGETGVLYKTMDGGKTWMRA